jgi:DNA-binding PadR family transcriptional regulator
MDKPLHGYQINKLIRDKEGIGLVWHINLSNIYALLDVLEKKNYIKKAKEPNTDNSYPPKKYFEITKRGKNIFEDWLVTPVTHGRDFRQSFLVKWYFCSMMDGKLKKTLVNKQITEIEKWIKEITWQKKNSKTTFKEFVISYRLSQIENIRDWLQQNTAI